MLKLREWIDPDKLDWNLLGLNSNPYVFNFFKENPNKKIDLYFASKNNNYIEIL